jgi:hypothetical protein
MALQKYLPEWTCQLSGHEEEYVKNNYKLYFYAPNGEGFMYSLAYPNGTFFADTISAKLKLIILDNMSLLQLTNNYYV